MGIQGATIWFLGAISILTSPLYPQSRVTSLFNAIHYKQIQLLFEILSVGKNDRNCSAPSRGTIVVFCHQQDHGVITPRRCKFRGLQPCLCCEDDEQSKAQRPCVFGSVCA